MWHGQQITLRIKPKRFCGLACKVYVHICQTSECNSQLCLHVAVVFLVVRKSDSALPTVGKARYAQVIAEQGERESIQNAVHNTQTCLLGYSCDKCKCVPATSPDWFG